MCGRFLQRFSRAEAAAFFGLDGPTPNLRPRYNLAPSQPAAVVRVEAGTRRLAMLRWGLVPEWATDPRIGYRLVNARAETVATKPAFRGAFASRRCLVPADGFYEWRRAGAVREPWLVAPRGEGLMAFAGLWERWRVPEGVALPGPLAERRPGEALETFTILTTRANATMRALHPRMPVILAPEAFTPWLSGGKVALGPAPEARLAMYPVDARVNSPRVDDPGCVVPVAPMGTLL